MLLANPDAGTVTCLEMAMGANSSVQKRLIACLVFSRALPYGTKLGEVVVPSKEYLNPLCEVSGTRSPSFAAKFSFSSCVIPM